MAIKYQVILADPPWDFLTRSDKGKGKAPPYPVMGAIDLLNLPVREIAAPDSVLFLWTTWPMMWLAMNLFEEWGFTYRTLGFEWLKLTKHGKLHIGTGYYTRANPEPCLIGVRGQMPVATHSERNVLIEEEVPGGVLVDHWGGHSVKPESAYQKIERLYPRDAYPRRLELFASAQSLPHALAYGYRPLGFDVDGQDIRTALREVIFDGRTEHQLAA